MTNIDQTDSLRTDTRAVDDHARLVATLVGDAIRAGLDSLRLNLGPRVERVLIDRTVEHIETAGYTLAIPQPEGDNHAKGAH